MLRDGESNPGLPRDRRGYSPLYYRGVISLQSNVVYVQFQTQSEHKMSTHSNMHTNCILFPVFINIPGSPFLLIAIQFGLFWNSK